MNVKIHSIIAILFCIYEKEKQGIKKTWEIRYHPLRGEWVIIAAHRQSRPWQGLFSGKKVEKPPPYSKDCPFCPGNKRVSGVENPDYKSVFAFDNDHPCVGEKSPIPQESPGFPYTVKRAFGKSRVLCYDPRHDLSLCRLPLERVIRVIEAWQDERKILSKIKDIEHVYIFENRGKEVGVSNPHPHCQIYALPFVFETFKKESELSESYYKEKKRTILQDMLHIELEQGKRIIEKENGIVSFIPWCARWAYETWIVPLEPYKAVEELDTNLTKSLARILKNTLIRMDNLWRMEMPYILALHDAPKNRNLGFHFHIEIYPLFRKPGLLKYLAGPETGGGSFLADTSPEEKAEELKNINTKHYMEEDNESC